MIRVLGFIVVMFVASLDTASVVGKDQITGKSDLAENANLAKPRRAGETRRDNGLNMTFVWAPPGRFQMGSPVEKRKELIRQSNEGPVDVELTNGFWIAQSEVTQKQWTAIMETEPWTGRFHVVAGDDYPATFMTSVRAVEFCEKLTDIERGRGRLSVDYEYSLPTEAEWEYACRAGTTTAYSFGDSVDELDNYAWTFFNTRGARVPRKVMTRKPNPWGLFDMHGNVYELCFDEYHDELQSGVNPVRVSITPVYGRVIRGGSLLMGRMTSAARNNYSAHRATFHIGFRPVIVKQRGIQLPDDRETPDEIEDVERKF